MGCHTAGAIRLRIEYLVDIDSVQSRHCISTEMVVLPLIGAIASVAGNRLCADYGAGRSANLCCMIVLSAPPNSRKSNAYNLIQDGMLEFQAMFSEKVSVALTGKMTRAGLIGELLRSTNGRHSILLHYEEMANQLEWFGRVNVRENGVYIEKVFSIE